MGEMSLCGRVRVHGERFEVKDEAVLVTVERLGCLVGGHDAFKHSGWDPALGLLCNGLGLWRFWPKTNSGSCK